MRGGHNKRKLYTGQFLSLNSFDIIKPVKVLREAGGGRKHLEAVSSWTNGSQITMTIYADHVRLKYLCNGGLVEDDVYLEDVPNTYGGMSRIYFICPYCGENAKMIYLHDRHFKCRRCADLNYACQQITKNSDMPIYKIRSLLIRKFKMRLEDVPVPMDYLRFTPDRPKGMHQRTYDRLLIEYYKLREVYHREFMKEAGRILGRRG